MCEVSIHPPISLSNLLAGPLRFELNGRSGHLGGILPSGGCKHAHSFGMRTPVALTVQAEARRARAAHAGW